jgi:uncharacterized protein YjbI with pentapeptide repeats
MFYRQPQRKQEPAGMAEVARPPIERTIADVNRMVWLGGTLVASLALAMAALFLIVAATTDRGLLWSRVDLVPLGLGLSIAAAGLIAPLAFVALHVAALYVLDLLGRRVAAVGAALRRPAMKDQRAAYIARLRGLAVTRIVAGDEAHGVGQWLLRLVLWLVVTAGPLAALLAVQIGLVRYQWPEMVQSQQVALGVDAAALIWFHLRLFRRRAADISFLRRATNPALAVVAVVVGFLYVNPPPADTPPTDVRWGEAGAAGQGRAANFTSLWLAPALQGYNILDVVLCPATGWGCRYLHLDSRALANDGSSPKALIEPLAAARPPAGNMAAPGGIVLDGRDLRFADFSGSTLRAAALRDAVLDGASFRQARLEGADLDGAQLTNAALDGADFTGASLRRARFDGASFHDAVMKGARMDAADLVGAQILNAELQGAMLGGARLTGAAIKWSHLEGADLAAAQLDNGFIFQSFLGGASLDGAILTGATLRENDLSAASVVAADVEGARLERNNYRLLDFRDVAIGTAGVTIDPMPSAAHEVVHSLWGPHSTWPHPPAPAEYAAKAAITLKDLACADRWVAAGIFRRLAAGTVADDPQIAEDHARIADLLRAAIEQARAQGGCAALAGVDLAALMGQGQPQN